VAELVGPTGKITAVEIDAGLAEKARIALESWSQITVNNADGSKLSFEPADLIVASAGATHPLTSWLDAAAITGGKWVASLNPAAVPACPLYSEAPLKPRPMPGATARSLRLWRV
jgi:protein-L-isoaspartate O-methyltransferase